MKLNELPLLKIGVFVPPPYVFWNSLQEFRSAPSLKVTITKIVFSASLYIMDKNALGGNNG